MDQGHHDVCIGDGPAALPALVSRLYGNWNPLDLEQTGWENLPNGIALKLAFEDCMIMLEAYMLMMETPDAHDMTVAYRTQILARLLYHMETLRVATVPPTAEEASVYKNLETGHGDMATRANALVQLELKPRIKAFFIQYHDELENGYVEMMRDTGTAEETERNRRDYEQQLDDGLVNEGLSDLRPAKRPRTLKGVMTLIDAACALGWPRGYTTPLRTMDAYIIQARQRLWVNVTHVLSNLVGVRNGNLFATWLEALYRACDPLFDSAKVKATQYADQLAGWANALDYDADGVPVAVMNMFTAVLASVVLVQNTLATMDNKTSEKAVEAGVPSFSIRRAAGALFDGKVLPMQLVALGYAGLGAFSIARSLGVGDGMKGLLIALGTNVGCLAVGQIVSIRQLWHPAFNIAIMKQGYLHKDNQGLIGRQRAFASARLFTGVMIAHVSQQFMNYLVGVTVRVLLPPDAFYARHADERHRAGQRLHWGQEVWLRVKVAVEETPFGSFGVLRRFLTRVLVPLAPDAAKAALERCYLTPTQASHLQVTWWNYMGVALGALVIGGTAAYALDVNVWASVRLSFQPLFAINLFMENMMRTVTGLEATMMLPTWLKLPLDGLYASVDLETRARSALVGGAATFEEEHSWLAFAVGGKDTVTKVLGPVVDTMAWLAKGTLAALSVAYVQPVVSLVADAAINGGLKAMSSKRQETVGVQVAALLAKFCGRTALTAVIFSYPVSAALFAGYAVSLIYIWSTAGAPEPLPPPKPLPIARNDTELLAQRDPIIQDIIQQVLVEFGAAGHGVPMIPTLEAMRATLLRTTDGLKAIHDNRWCTHVVIPLGAALRTAWDLTPNFGGAKAMLAFEWHVFTTVFQPMLSRLAIQVPIDFVARSYGQLESLVGDFGKAIDTSIIVRDDGPRLTMAQNVFAAVKAVVAAQRRAIDHIIASAVKRSPSAPADIQLVEQDLSAAWRLFDDPVLQLNMPWSDRISNAATAADALFTAAEPGQWRSWLPWNWQGSTLGEVVQPLMLAGEVGLPAPPFRIGAQTDVVTPFTPAVKVIPPGKGVKPPAPAPVQEEERHEALFGKAAYTLRDMAEGIDLVAVLKNDGGRIHPLWNRVFAACDQLVTGIYDADAGMQRAGNLELMVSVEALHRYLLPHLNTPEQAAKDVNLLCRMLVAQSPVPPPNSVEEIDASLLAGYKNYAHKNTAAKERQTMLRQGWVPWFGNLLAGLTPAAVAFIAAQNKHRAVETARLVAQKIATAATRAADKAEADRLASPAAEAAYKRVLLGGQVTQSVAPYIRTMTGLDVETAPKAYIPELEKMVGKIIERQPGFFLDNGAQLKSVLGNETLSHTADELLTFGKAVTERTGIKSFDPESQPRSAVFDKRGVRELVHKMEANSKVIGDELGPIQRQVLKGRNLRYKTTAREKKVEADIKAAEGVTPAFIQNVPSMIETAILASPFGRAGVLGAYEMSVVLLNNATQWGLVNAIVTLTNSELLGYIGYVATGPRTKAAMVGVAIAYLASRVYTDAVTTFFTVFANSQESTLVALELVERSLRAAKYWWEGRGAHSLLDSGDDDGIRCFYECQSALDVATFGVSKLKHSVMYARNVAFIANGPLMMAATTDIGGALVAAKMPMYGALAAAAGATALAGLSLTARQYDAAPIDHVFKGIDTLQNKYARTFGVFGFLALGTFRFFPRPTWFDPYAYPLTQFLAITSPVRAPHDFFSALYTVLPAALEVSLSNGSLVGSTIFGDAVDDGVNGDRTIEYYQAFCEERLYLVVHDIIPALYGPLYRYLRDNHIEKATDEMEARWRAVAPPDSLLSSYQEFLDFVLSLGAYGLVM